jgi:uncharacterized protein
MKIVRSAIRAVFGLILLICVFYSSSAITPPPPPQKYVNDFASVLKANTVDSLSRQLADFDHQTSDELIVVIYPNLPKGISIGEYARDLYDSWKIGKRGKDTGALLLIAIQEHQVRVHAGKGLQNRLSETTCQKIFTDTIAPRLDANDFDGACKAGVKALVAAASAK